MTLQPFRDVTDERIIAEANRELKDLEEELRALKDLNAEMFGVVQSQAPALQKTEVKTQEVFKEVVQAEKNLKQASKSKDSERKFFLFTGAGGVAGSALGAVGFAINPVAGAVAMVVMGLLGAGAGGLASKVS